MQASAIRAAVDRVVESGWFILGAEVGEFEREWATYCGSKHCVGTGNALDGLEIALRAVRLPVHGKVIVPSNTYIATWLAITNAGLRVFPVEPDPASHNLSADRVAAAIESTNVVAVLGVHLFGQLADEAICDVAREAGIPALFDAAQAHGAKNSRGDSSGSIGDVAVHSYYPTKNLGAVGDGGSITTDNEEIAESARLNRNYGSRRKYENQVRGRNSRLDEIQAAVLRERLPLLDEANDRRRDIASRYSTELAGLGRLSIPPSPIDPGRHVWHAYNVLCESAAHRQRLIDHLTSLGVGTQVFYPVPPHMSPAYRDHGWKPGDFPIAEAFAATSLALPIAPYLTEAEVDYTIRAVKSWAG